MSPMDILGDLIKSKMRSGGGDSGRGGDPLRDIVRGGRRAPAQTHPRARRPRSIDDAAASLEDLLGVGGGSPSPAPPSPATHRTPTSPAARVSTPRREPSRSDNPFDPSSKPEALTDKDKVLIRAMLGACKADGNVSRQEQDAIFKQLGDVSKEEMAFLRDEFDKVGTARDLAWSVPLGMEQIVYQVSLLAVQLDQQKEANYLAELAHGLRLDPKWVNDVHEKYGAPVIFKF